MNYMIVEYFLAPYLTSFHIFHLFTCMKDLYQCPHPFCGTTKSLENELAQLLKMQSTPADTHLSRSRLMGGVRRQQGRGNAALHRHIGRLMATWGQRAADSRRIILL